jgi:glycerate dehydrogenase
VDLTNLLITPHIAWASRQAQQRLAREVVMNIEAYFWGEQRNRII